MTTTLFIFNLIWALLGIIVFIQLINFIRLKKNEINEQAKESRIHSVIAMKRLRDMHFEYGQNAAAKKLDEEIRKRLEEIEL